MNIIILIGYMILLGRIFQEDFREREVKAIWFFLMLACILVIFPISAFTLKQALMNAVLLGTELFITAIYFKVIRGNKDNFFDGIIGWGDVLMLLLFCLCYSFANYVLFIFSAFFVALICHFAFKKIFSTYKSNVPLAGVMALYHGVLLLGAILLKQGPSINYSDILLFQPD